MDSCVSLLSAINDKTVAISANARPKNSIIIAPATGMSDEDVGLNEFHPKQLEKFGATT
jgi:hypothetical protein